MGEQPVGERQDGGGGGGTHLKVCTCVRLLQFNIPVGLWLPAMNREREHV